MAVTELNSKQHKAIAVLLSEPTIKAAAEKLGVGERTLYNWLSDPAFDAAYRAARRDAVRQAVAQLQRSAAGAAAALATIAEDPAEPARARVAAARAILEMAIKAVEFEDMDARIAALERKYAEDHEQAC